MAEDHENNVTRLDFGQGLEDQNETLEFVHTQLAEPKARQKRLNFWNYLSRFIIGLVLGAGTIGGILALFGML